MEPSFLVHPSHIHQTMDQCAVLCVRDNFYGYKLYVPEYRNKKSDIIHKHDVSFQSDILVAVYNSSCNYLYL